MNDRTEILLRLFEEAMVHVRHLEEQRATFASVLVAVTGGVVAFGLSDGKVHTECYPDLLLTAIGAFGLLLSWKQNEQINYHRVVAIRHREHISAVLELAELDLERRREIEAATNASSYLGIAKIPVGLFWSMLYGMIFLFGILIRAFQ